MAPPRRRGISFIVALIIPHFSPFCIGNFPFSKNCLGASLCYNEKNLSYARRDLPMPTLSHACVRVLDLARSVAFTGDPGTHASAGS